MKGGNWLWFAESLFAAGCQLVGAGLRACGNPVPGASHQHQVLAGWLLLCSLAGPGPELAAQHGILLNSGIIPRFLMPTLQEDRNILHKPWVEVPLCLPAHLSCVD